MRTTAAAIAAILLLATPNQVRGEQELDTDHIARVTLALILGAIDRAHGNRDDLEKTDVLRRVSNKLFQCSVMYGGVSKLSPPPPGVNDRQALLIKMAGTAHKVFQQIVPVLHPDPPQIYEKELRKAGAAVFIIKNNQRELFQFMRLCRDLSEPDLIPSAVTEIALGY